MEIRDKRWMIRTYRKESLSRLTSFGNINARKEIRIMFEEVVEAVVRLYPQDKARDYYVYLVREAENATHRTMRYAEENFGSRNEEGLANGHPPGRNNDSAYRGRFQRN